MKDKRPYDLSSGALRSADRKKRTDASLPGQAGFVSAPGAPATWHPLLGAHMSIAGGLHRALEEASLYRCGAVQLFTRNSNQWAAKPLTEDAIRRFREADAALGPFEIAAHGSYLINLGSPDASLYKRSIDALVQEIERCEALSIPRLVFHPGSHMGEGEAAGLLRIAGAVRDALGRTAGFRTRLLLENTAGQGTSLGHALEHLAELLERIGQPGRTGVCLDTCHLLAAGHEFRTIETYAELREELADRIVLERIHWFHLNDCRADIGKRIDRHAHIGKGFIGSKPFSFFLNDPVFRRVPMILETPKEDGMDRRNIALLRRLSRAPVGRAPGARKSVKSSQAARGRRTCHTLRVCHAHRARHMDDTLKDLYTNGSANKGIG